MMVVTVMVLRLVPLDYRLLSELHMEWCQVLVQRKG